MTTTLRDLTGDVLYRLGDPEQRIWTTDETAVHLRNGYQDLATSLRLFWDWTYLENLPRGFSYTAAWEKADGYVTFDWGIGNYTLDDEQRLLGDERLRVGPAWYTSPFEATDGWLSDVGANVAIPATADLPDTLTNLDRVTWDKRGLDALSPRAMQRVDSRYEITKGEVYGFMWEKDGLRTLRKVRVPAAQASTATINGWWGGMRDPADLSTDTCGSVANVIRRFTYTQPWEAVLAWADGLVADGRANYTAAFERGLIAGPQSGPAWFTSAFWLASGYLTLMGHDTPSPATVSWGVPRRIPGHHPIGMSVQFGLPRRPFLDNKNIRVEHHRVGAPLDASASVCELPDRYAKYLRDYAQWKMLLRKGPGQDVTLAAHFQQRWERGKARIQTRLDLINREELAVLGGDGQQLTTRPPRPSRPWPYGSVVR